MTQNQKLTRFVKHIMIASQKQEQRKKAHTDLQKQISKLKTTKNIDKEIKKLQTKIDIVLEQEGKILTSTETNKETIKKELEEMDDDIRTYRNQDVKLIDDLRKQIKQLGYELRTKEEDNKEEIEQVNGAVQEIKGKINEYISTKTERDKQIAELEKRIKNKVNKNFNEIIKIEKQIQGMEEKYLKIKKQGKYDKTILEEFEEKIVMLKEKLIHKKSGIKTEIPKIRIQNKKNLPMKKENHELAIPMEEPILPPLPPIQEKKKGFFAKLLKL